LREVNDVLKTMKKFQITIPVNEFTNNLMTQLWHNGAPWVVKMLKLQEEYPKFKEIKGLTLACFSTKKGFRFSIELSW
jgi:hypothetical protein